MGIVIRVNGGAATVFLIAPDRQWLHPLGSAEPYRL